MILQILVGDSKTKEEIKLDFRAINNNKLRNHLVNYKNQYGVLKTILIYGDNQVLENNKVFQMIENSIGHIICDSLYKMENNIFEIIFDINGMTYHYGFEYKNSKLQNEFLSYYNFNDGNVENQIIFNRDYKNNYEFSKKYQWITESLKYTKLNDKLFIAKVEWINHNNKEFNHNKDFDEFLNVYRYLINNIKFYRDRQNNESLCFENQNDTCYFYYNLDSKIHTINLEKLIYDVQDNKNNNQIVGCLYDINFMNPRIMRSDEISFMDIVDDKYKIHSLCDFIGVDEYKTSYDLQRAYLCGKFGAIPV